MALYELVVIGGGAGGLAAARAASRAGRRVALVEAERPGGDCTYYGCVPSKTLIEAARRVHHSRHGEPYGFRAEVGVDFAAVMRRVHATVTEIGRDESPEVLATEGVHLISGRASFTDPDTVEVDGRQITADRFVIATGGRPSIPRIRGLDGVAYLTNRTVFDLTTLPEHLLVLGGGPVGCELAQAFARLGSRATILQSAERILPRDEAECAAVLADVFAAEGITLRTRSEVESADGQDGDVRLGLADGSTVAGSHLLVAAGRQANTESLNLRAAGVVVDRAGSVVVNSALRTSQPHIYAVGDCAADHQLTHLADEQGRVAAGNAFRRRPRTVPAALPWVTFTDPEVAHVGMTEAEAYAAHGTRAMVSVLPMSAVDRARCAGETAGFIKVVAVPRKPVPSILAGRIVGATVVGARAGEVLAELALAVQTRMFAGRVAQTVHAYPTWSLGNRQAVALFAGSASYGDAARPAQPGH